MEHVIIPSVNRAPRILVTNDDGYTSEGIQILADALDSLGEVWVVAPDSEQSAVSHALTLDRPLRIKRLGERRVAVDGTPTDCVALAVANLMGGHPPDVVVSGINFGFNMGADVHYSGTVSAAFEGVILGVPAMAVSLEVGEGMSFHLAAKFSKILCGWILEQGLPKDTLLNVNVPLGTPKGVKLTTLGVRRYTEGVVEQRDPRGRKIFWIGGGQPVWEPIPDTDFHEVAEGFVSVTPLQLDMTGRSLLDTLREQELPWLDSSGLSER